MIFLNLKSLFLDEDSNIILVFLSSLGCRATKQNKWEDIPVFRSCGILIFSIVIILANNHTSGCTIKSTFSPYSATQWKGSHLADLPESQDFWMPIGSTYHVCISQTNLTLRGHVGHYLEFPRWFNLMEKPCQPSSFSSLLLLLLSWINKSSTGWQIYKFSGSKCNIVCVSGKCSEWDTYFLWALTVYSYLWKKPVDEMWREIMDID